MRTIDQCIDGATKSCKGEFVDSHHIILLLINYLKQYKKMDGKVVIAFSVSDRIKKLCKALGLEVVTTKIGFKYVCDKLLSDDVLLGGEESGAGAGVGAGVGAGAGETF